MNKPDSLVSSPAAEDFLVASIVNDETQLSKSKRQESGVAEFCPRIVKSCYQQESAHEQNNVEKDFSAVVRRLFRQ
jgi:hypothetical protein